MNLDAETSKKIEELQHLEAHLQGIQRSRLRRPGHVLRDAEITGEQTQTESTGPAPKRPGRFFAHWMDCPAPTLSFSIINF